MHILFVLEKDSRQGAALSAINLVRELHKKYGDEIAYSIIVPLGYDRADLFENMGCTVYKMPYACYCHGIPEKKEQYLIRYMEKWVKYHMGRILMPLFTVFYIKTGKLDIKGIDLIHCNSFRLDAGAYLAAKYKKPLVQHIREFGDLDFERFHLRKNYITYINRNTQCFFVVSEAARNHWIKKGIDESKTICIHDGVNEKVRVKDYRKTRNGSRGITKFVFIGGLDHTKGQHQALEALAALPGDIQVKMDIVGDGNSDYKKQCLDFVKDHKMEDKVHFLGYRNGYSDDLSEYDCGIMCSKSEGFGRVTVEYMMAGLPVIASDTGASPELVKNGVNGLLYEWNNIDDLKEKILYISENKREAERMGRNGRKIAMENFTQKINAQRIHQAYLTIIAGGR